MHRADFWSGKRVLLTGHTGFKGSWLAIWLNHLGAQVFGAALAPLTEPSLYTLSHLEELIDGHICDIRDAKKLESLVRSVQPEIVLHLAAQPLVRASYDDPVGTYATNVMGTVHLLNTIRALDYVRIVLVVTTDKVYQNDDEWYPFRETDALGGHDPYSASKAAAELVVSSYREAFLGDKGVAIASARAGNVIGGGDWSADRLIPDAIRAWNNNSVLHIRRPHAVRPWQHVLEPLSAYMTLCERLWKEPDIAGPYNLGPSTEEVMSVQDVILCARNCYGDQAKVKFETEASGPHEAHWLSLETTKARNVLGIRPHWNTKTAIERSIQWYQKLTLGRDARTLCLDDIVAYEASGQA